MSILIDLGSALEKGTGTLALPRMTDNEYYEFCQRNRNLHVERNAQGDLILMSPVDVWTESRGSELLIDLGIWNRGLKFPGLVAGSSAGFKLPNGADRSPDAAWVAHDRWKSVPIELRRPFAHISPDFVVEVMSPSDELAEAKRKMEEYAVNGVRLGWLIDRKHRMAYVYRSGQEPVQVSNPATLSAEPELQGFIANLNTVFAEDTP